ncbi:hypothetical protein ACES2L_13885 [Bdellovibrio bacteriovorus]
MFTKIPEEVREFIKQNVHSVALLDMLLMMKQNSEKEWSARHLSQEMRTNVDYAASQLAVLVSKGFVVPTQNDCFKYNSENYWNAIVDQLEQYYNLHRATVINHIYSQPIDSIRGFADAFKIKKD